MSRGLAIGAYLALGCIALGWGYLRGTFPDPGEGGCPGLVLHEEYRFQLHGLRDWLSVRFLPIAIFWGGFAALTTYLQWGHGYFGRGLSWGRPLLSVLFSLVSGYVFVELASRHAVANASSCLGEALRDQYAREDLAWLGWLLGSTADRFGEVWWAGSFVDLVAVSVGSVLVGLIVYLIGWGPLPRTAR